uniref:aromatase n=1 Tax=Labrus bergylta TaxID=56723 RepID=A0A3Q3EB22_9LABR
MVVLLGSYTIPFLGVSVFIAALIYITYTLLSDYLRKWFEMKPIPQVEGHIPSLETRCKFFRQIEDYTREFADAPLLKLWIGPVPFVILFHAETVEPIVTNPVHMEKAVVYNFLHPWLGTGLLTSTGSKWRQRRKMLTPTFHFSILADFLEVMNEQAEILVEKLDKKVGKGSFNCFSHITLCALDIICETAMGKKIYAQSNSDSEYVKSVYKMSDIISRRQRTPWFWSDLVYYYFGEGKEHNRILKVLHSFTYKVINERAENVSNSESDSDSDDGAKKRRAFLDMLLKTTDEEGNGMSHQDIQEEVDTFMFEYSCHATVSNSSGMLSGHKLSFCDLKASAYIRRLLKNIFPTISRTFFVPVDGFKVPKGANAVIIPYARHRDPRYFPEPEEFRPERFLPENSVGRPPYAYIPFSAGLRNCIGQRFALMEEKVILSSILRNFNIEACQTREELQPVGELILRPENGIWIKLEKRKLQTL